MGLDDAISKARQDQDFQEQQKRQEEEQQRRDHLRLAALLAEAAKRLLPYRGETLHRMRASSSGAFRGQDGRRYQQVFGHWCWLIKDLDRNSVWGPSVMLLVLEGSTAHAVRAELNLKSGKAGQYVTSQALEPVGGQHYTQNGVMAFFSGAWIDELEKDLGAAIARYQRG